MTAGRGASYRRLPGRARRLFDVSTLWYTDDHLLLVIRQAFSESYRRYYFRDIQSIAMHRDGRGSVWWALLGLASILVVIPAVASFIAGAPGRWWWGSAGGVVLIGLGIHWWRGATCCCRMRTILQEAEIAPLRRMRWVRSALAIIEPLLEASQGSFDRALLLEQVKESTEAHHETAPQVKSKVPPPPPLPRGSTRLHVVLCYLFLADALVTTLQIALPGRLLSALGSALVLAEFAVVITALTRQKATFLGRTLRPFTWIAFGVLCLAALTSWIAAVLKGINAAAEGMPVAPNVPAAPAGVYLAYVIVYVAIGIFGLILLRRHRDETEHRWLNLKG